MIINIKETVNLGIKSLDDIIKEARMYGYMDKCILEGFFTADEEGKIRAAVEVQLIKEFVGDDTDFLVTYLVNEDGKLLDGVKAIYRKRAAKYEDLQEHLDHFRSYKKGTIHVRELMEGGFEVDHMLHFNIPQDGLTKALNTLIGTFQSVEEEYRQERE